MREELEMDPDLPAVLLMGGGEGMGPVKKTAKALGQSLFCKELEKPIGQLIIICGRNKTLASSLETEEWKIPVKVIFPCLYSTQLLLPLIKTFTSIFIILIKPFCIFVLGSRIREPNAEMDGSL